MRSGILLILISASSIFATAREESRRDFSKTVPLTAGRAVRVEHRHGRVSIHTHSRNDVQVQAVIRCSAPTADEARACADQVRINVQESSSGVSVRTEYPQNWRNNISYAVDCDITMPANAPLDLRNQFGSVDVSSIQSDAVIRNGNGNVALLASRGRHRVENAFGSIEVRNNDGDVTIVNGNGAVTAIDITGAVDITNRFGSIRAANVGRTLTVKGNNNSVEVDNVGGLANISNSFNRVTVTGAKNDVIVQNQNGEIVANDIAGNADLRTSFASINAMRLSKNLTVRAQNTQVRAETVGETATVETTFGSVDLRNVRGAARVTSGNSPIKLTGVGGEIYAKSSFNSITILDSPGPVTVEGQNGAVVVDAKSAGTCKPLSLGTTFGLIRVTVPRGLGYNLTAQTTFGRIHTDPGVQVTVSGDIGQNRLTGKIGAGGCDLRLLGQNSNIDILSR